jgi:hypothetical protein
VRRSGWPRAIAFTLSSSNWATEFNSGTSSNISSRSHTTNRTLWASQQGVNETVARHAHRPAFHADSPFSPCSPSTPLVLTVWPMPVPLPSPSSPPFSSSSLLLLCPLHHYTWR